MLVKNTNSGEDLLNTLENLSEKLKDGYCIFVPISKMGKNYNTHFQQKIITNVLNDIFKNTDSLLFFVANGDLFLLNFGKDSRVIEKAIDQLNYLFIEDSVRLDARKDLRICEIYDLKLQLEDVIDRAKTSLNIPVIKKNKMPFSFDPTELNRTKSLGSNPDSFNQINIYNLPKIVSIIQKTDCYPALRSQPICVFDRSKRTFKPVVYEIYLHIRHLNKLLYPGTDLLSDPYLFRSITTHLDKKVLNLLMKRNTALIDSAFSINLSLATVISKEFEEINYSLRKSIKNEIIIEIQLADMFFDIPSFNLACKKLKSFGYKLCLDGVNSITFQHISRAVLGFDMLKLHWEDDISITYKEALKKAVERDDAKRIILSRCNNAGSINFGLDLGISIFQGRYVDLMINPDSKITN